MTETGGRSPEPSWRFAVDLLLVGLAVLSSTEGFGAALEPATLESNEGYYQLRWEAEEPIRLVEASTADFADARVLYTGTDTGHVVSGKPDGVWYYRLESVDGARTLSDPATITVRHHSLLRAFSFFALGVVVFAATLGLILFGGRDQNERA